MQIQVDIGFDELIGIVKRLPKDQFIRLKNELNKEEIINRDLQNLESFLLGAPTFSEQQIEAIAQTRNAINQWRTK